MPKNNKNKEIKCKICGGKKHFVMVEFSAHKPMSYQRPLTVAELRDMLEKFDDYFIEKIQTKPCKMSLNSVLNIVLLK